MFYIYIKQQQNMCISEKLSAKQRIEQCRIEIDGKINAANIHIPKIQLLQIRKIFQHDGKCSTTFLTNLVRAARDGRNKLIGKRRA